MFLKFKQKVKKKPNTEIPNKYWRISVTMKGSTQPKYKTAKQWKLYLN